MTRKAGCGGSLLVAPFNPADCARLLGEMNDASILRRWDDRPLDLHAGRQTRYDPRGVANGAEFDGGGDGRGRSSLSGQGDTMTGKFETSEVDSE